MVYVELSDKLQFMVTEKHLTVWLRDSSSLNGTQYQAHSISGFGYTKRVSRIR